MPIVTHVHGAVGVGDESDGYAEAWYLPAADNIPAGYATEGTWYDFFKDKAKAKFGAELGTRFRHVPIPKRRIAHRPSGITTTRLGMTRLNVYAGPAGFYIVRGGAERRRAGQPQRNASRAAGTGAPGERQVPAEQNVLRNSTGDPGSCVQRRRLAFLSGFPAVLRRSSGRGPYIPTTDISPIWNPEFFGNMMMVNGNTWPYQIVEQRRYRLRFLNGCDSRFLILRLQQIPGVEVWQIGNEGGFLPAPVNITAITEPAVDGRRRTRGCHRGFHQRAGR